MDSVAISVFLSDPLFIFLIILLFIWEISWKGIGLWYAARNNHKTWFLFMLFVVSGGILPIIYLRLVLESKSRMSVFKVKK
ncbi:MAG: DUF5652 family protein [Candidatus Woesearchaeota archaeon]